MYKPKRLWLRNFMAFQDQEFVFKNGNAVMINGENFTDEGQKSNGSGKSGILEGIAICLINSPLRPNTGIKDLVRDGQKQSTVMLELEHTSGTLIKIERETFVNTKSGKLKITVDGIEKTDLVSVRDGDKWIIDTIGISREDLLNYFLLSKEKYVSFLNMSDTAKKQVIGRFAQSNLIDPVYDIIQAEVDELEVKAAKLERANASNEGKIAVYIDERDKHDVEDLKKRRTKRIEEINEEKTLKKAKKVGYGNQIVIQTKKLEELKVELAAFGKEESTAKLDTKLSNNKSETTEIQKELDEAEQLKIDANKALMGAVECPKCKHEFSIGDDSFDLKETRDSLEEIDLVIKEIEEDLGKLRGQKIILRAHIGSVEKDNDVLRKNIRNKNTEISTQTDLIAQYERGIKTVQRELNDLDATLLTIDKVVISDRTKEFNDSIEEAQKQIDKNNVLISNIEVERFEKNEWNAIMNKFKTHLSNKAISVIEAHCNEYLKRFRTTLTVKLEGYKLLKSGKTRENISTSVLRDGLMLGILGKFSGGEKMRIEIAMILALQKLINMNTESGGLDLCFLDEIIESVDSEGIYGIMKALNQLGQTIIAITHGTLHRDFQNTVRVEKRKDISTIIQ